MASGAAELAERPSMKVAVVSPYAFDAHGGVQDQVSRIVSWLRDEGHEAWAVAPGSGGPPGTRHVGRYRSVPANRSRAPISLNPRIGPKVLAAVADADVVHIHEPLMPFVGLAALRGDTPPKVGTFHADPGGWARFTYRTAAPLIRRWLGRLGVVTAVSALAADAVRHLCEPEIVPNGIDLEPYTDSGAAPVGGRVVFVGRDDPRKGLDVLLESWRTVRAELPEATLHVVGAMRAAAPPGVVFLGRVGEERKASELSSAEVLVAPNLGGESFGITVLEGMAAGCAVVASDLSAFRSVAGDAARFVPVGDSAALADAVVGLLRSDRRRRSLAQAGRVRSTRFTRSEVLGAYLAAYRTAISGS